MGWFGGGWDRTTPQWSPLRLVLHHWNDHRHSKIWPCVCKKSPNYLLLLLLFVMVVVAVVPWPLVIFGGEHVTRSANLSRVVDRMSWYSCHDHHGPSWPPPLGYRTNRDVWFRHVVIRVTTMWRTRVRPVPPYLHLVPQSCTTRRWNDSVERTNSEWPSRPFRPFLRWEYS